MKSVLIGCSREIFIKAEMTVTNPERAHVYTNEFQRHAVRSSSNERISSDNIEAITTPLFIRGRVVERFTVTHWYTAVTLHQNDWDAGLVCACRHTSNWHVSNTC